MKVNPRLGHKALVMAFNPRTEPVKTTLRLPLYYTGLKDTARVREQEGEFKTYTLDRDYRIEIEAQIEPESRTWFVIE